MTTDILKNEQLSDLLFDHAEQLDMDSDYWFRLRGQSINPMIDAVTPLLGLVQRVRLLSRYDRVPELYQRVVTEIQAIEQELMAQGYENGVVLSFRYILCTFIDEAVMGRDWGSQSEWSEHSLLTRFHNETWGGEKVFVLLTRLQEDPVRYRDILEFIYLCLCLGLRGKYGIDPKGDEALQALILKLREIILELRGPPPDLFGDPLANVAPRDVRLRREWPWWSPLVVSAITLAGLYGYYRYRLDLLTREAIEALNTFLQP